MSIPHSLAGRAAALWLTAAMVGCSAGKAPPSTDDAAVTAARNAPTAANQAGVVSLPSVYRAWIYRRHDGTVSVAAGVSIPLPTGWGKRPANAVRTALDKYLALDADSVLALEQDTTTPDGVRHLRFQQYHAGLPVHHARLTVHLRGHHITSWNASLAAIHEVRAARLETGDLARAPWSDEDTRILHVSQEIQWWVDTGGTAEPAVVVLTAPGHDTARAPTGERLLVSLVDGRMLSREALTRGDESPYPACRNGTDLNCRTTTTGTGDDGVTYDLNLFRGQGFPLPYLLDGYLHPYEGDDYPDLFGDGDEADTYFVDLSRVDEIGPIYIISSDGSVFSSYDRQFFDSGDFVTHGPGPTFDDAEFGAGVSALVAVEATLDYYWVQHGRRGIDDAVSPMDVVVRADLSGYNASWIPDYNLMCIGTSWGTSVAVAQDIVAHELTHGVIDFSSDLEYSGQTGALNEALADLFGMFVEAHVTGALNWSIGEAIPGRPPIRNLAHPELFGLPGHMSEYVGSDDGYTPLHYDSAIVNKAMYLAVMGTPPGRTYHGHVVTPIDADPWTSLELLESVAYDTMVFRLAPDSDFIAFALSMLGAAKDMGLAADVSQRLYSSLVEAFVATGILTDSEGNPLTLVGGRVVTGAQDAETPIPGAQVTLTLGDQVQDTTTDAAGNFAFELSVTGASSALLTAGATGYYDLTIALQVPTPDQAGGQDETVEVLELALTPRPTPSLRWEVNPSSMTVAEGDTSTATLTLFNDGPAGSELSFAVYPTVSYAWTEIPFAWEDLQDSVTPVMLSGDQGHSAELLLNRPFPFYLQWYDGLFLSTDGYLTLTEDTTEVYREMPIPSAGAPANLVAPFWADLDFGSMNRAYYAYDPSRSVAYVQYQDVPAYASPGDTYTFQAVLYPDGRIRFYYKDIPGAPDSWARTGIQDAEGREGLEVAVLRPGDSPPVPRSQSGIELTPSVIPSPDRIILQNQDEDRFGVLPSGTSHELRWTVSAADLAPGDYALEFRIETNDPARPLVHAPLSLHVP